MRLLVTGPGRSGTLWASRALGCGHEQAFNLNRHGGDWKADASWLAAPYLPLEDTYVVHLTRHPLDVIRSWRALYRGGGESHQPYAEFSLRFVPELAQCKDEIEIAAVRWLRWSEMIEKHAHETVQIERVTPEDVLRWARKVNPEAELSPLPGRVHQNPKVGRRLFWKDIWHIPGVMRMAQRLGYWRTH